MNIFFKFCLSGVVLGFATMFMELIMMLVFDSSDTESKLIKFFIRNPEGIIGAGGICVVVSALFGLFGLIWF